MVVEDAGHNVFADQPAALAAAMMDFVGMLNQARAQYPRPASFEPFIGAFPGAGCRVERGGWRV